MTMALPWSASNPFIAHVRRTELEASPTPGAAHEHLHTTPGGPSVAPRVPLPQLFYSTNPPLQPVVHTPSTIHSYRMPTPAPSRQPTPAPYSPVPPSPHVFPSNSVPQYPAAPIHAHHQPYFSATNPYAVFQQPMPMLRPLTLSTRGWSDDDYLSLSKANWTEWSDAVVRHIGLHAGASRFLDSNTVPPDPTLYAGHYAQWIDNDTVVRSFLASVCTPLEAEVVRAHGTAAAAWEALTRRHEQRGPVRQIRVVKDAFAVSFGEEATTFEKTLAKLKSLNKEIWAGGTPNPKAFLAALLMAALEKNHKPIVDGLVTRQDLSLEVVEKAILDKAEIGNGPASDVGRVAFATVAGKPARKKDTCTTPNCKYPDTHTTPFCVSEGGGMAGKTIREAQQAQKAAREKKSGSKDTSTQAKPNQPRVYLTIDGKTIPFTPSMITTSAPAASTTSTPNDPAAFCIELATDDTPSYDATYLNETYLTLDEAQLPFDWNNATVNAVDANAFLLFSDTGANVHVSPHRDDFYEFTPIAPRPIKGFQGTSVAATGIGSIATDKFTIRNVLYIPGATLRLLSVSRFCQDTGMQCYFDNAKTWITDSDGDVVCTGTLHSVRALYQLDCTLVHPVHATVNTARSLDSWHRRFGHSHHQACADLFQTGAVTGMELDPSSPPTPCDACILGKQIHAAIPKVREGEKSTRRLQKVFVDLSGQFSVVSRSGNRYILDIVDDASSQGWCIPIPHKSSACKMMQRWILAAENVTGERVGELQIDNGELKSTEFDDWCADRGIVVRYTSAETSAQNGKVERFHETLHNKARAMRIACDAPPYLWDEFYVTAAYLHARTPSRSQNGKTPYECFRLVKPDVSHLREIGCRAFVLILGHNAKLNRRSIECVLIGYSPRSKAYRCWDPKAAKVYDSIHVRFIESSDVVRVRYNKQLLARRLAECAREGSKTAEDDPIVPDDKPESTPVLTTSTLPKLEPELRRSTRVRKPAAHATIEDVDEDLDLVEERERLVAETMEDDDGVEADITKALNVCAAEAPIDVEYPDDPRTLREALAAPDAEEWIRGTHEELDGFRRMGVYRMIPRDQLPPGKTLLDLKPVYTRKRDASGTVNRRKVRYCVLGNRQIYGRNYTNTTSPTVRLESFRALLHLAASRGLDLQQVDIKTAYLNAPLPENEIQYCRQPRGFEDKERSDWIWMLLKSVYGLHQAGRWWNKTLNAAMTEWGFKRLRCEWCVYYRKNEDGKYIIVVVHVDDMLSAASSSALNDEFKAQLRSKWTISDLGNASFCLGISIVRDPERRMLAISQTALIDRIIAQFGQDLYATTIPMEPKLLLARPTPNDPPLSEEQRERLQRLPYRSLVGCLMYVAVGTRPDIAYAVNRLAGFLDCYREVHWNAALRVVQYLKGTRTFALHLGGGEERLSGFTDADWSNDVNNRKSVMGYCFSLGSGVISWASRKQKCVALSSAEAEYIAASEVTQEACWLRSLTTGVDAGPTGPTQIRCDNEAARILAKDQQFHARAKHIDTRYKHVADCVEKAKVEIPRVSSYANVADTLTKALPKDDFYRHRAALGVLEVGGVGSGGASVGGDAPRSPRGGVLDAGVEDPAGPD
uniref:Integrase catalytic domain-containing protein n=1 Tax=Mycena chlorophos TaxID=658473 RepID=A0ABQ0M1U3_MYCCL|nr:predicted protein [Mycena chlorophos]